MSDDIQKEVLSHYLAIKTAQEAIESYYNSIENVRMQVTEIYCFLDD